MPESEKSFADRLQKSQVLHDACAGFTPAYIPAAGTITLALYQGKIDDTDDLNAAVNLADANLDAVITTRVETVATIKALTTDLLAYIESVPAWAAKFPAAKKFADAIRGFKAPRKPLPPPVGDTPPPKRIERGGQSYAEIESNFDALVSLAIALPGFAPPNAAIGAAAISALLSSIKALNKDAALKETALGEAQKVRYAAYYAAGGLKETFGKVKKNVRGQYGATSTQWEQVRPMEW